MQQVAKAGIPIDFGAYAEWEHRREPLFLNKADREEQTARKLQWILPSCPVAAGVQLQNCAAECSVCGGGRRSS